MAHAVLRAVVRAARLAAIDPRPARPAHAAAPLVALAARAAVPRAASVAHGAHEALVAVARAITSCSIALARPVHASNVARDFATVVTVETGLALACAVCACAVPRALSEVHVHRAHTQAAIVALPARHAEACAQLWACAVLPAHPVSRAGVRAGRDAAVEALPAVVADALLRVLDVAAPVLAAVGHARLLLARLPKVTWLAEAVVRPVQIMILAQTVA
mmetsp:Transcript_4848/g.15689  ORF Transcript_4848/g.15689 Transcript_4848/m.15689 type:complete len:219 (+) Transcript_4848:769-1425(+)